MSGDQTMGAASAKLTDSYKWPGQKKGTFIIRPMGVLVETGESETLPSHNIPNLLAQRKALAVCCGRM